MPTSATSPNSNGSSLVVTNDDGGGVTVIDQRTPLKRLNYFDGKFLRADDFDVEQRYLRQLVAISNQGLGPGVVYGYDTTRIDGDTIQIGPGLAMDPSGTVLLLSSTITQSVAELIERSKPAGVSTPDASGKTGPGAFADCIEIPTTQTPPTVTAVSDVYVIAICPAEARCGQADVYGKLCEDACITTTDKKYRLDGVVLRAIPLSLVTPYPVSTAVDINGDKYLRSKIAHSWFADEVLRHPDSLSRPGLLSDAWCLGAGYTKDCCEVPLAIVARSGSTTVFLDAWTVRRERMEAPPQRYWQWKMRMRPMDVFLAQILQFQCHLADVLGERKAIAVPISQVHYQLLADTANMFEAMSEQAKGGGSKKLYEPQFEKLAGQWKKLKEKEDGPYVLKPYKPIRPIAPGERRLIDEGIIELPPAGYLPVETNTGVTVNDQVRALLGAGLDLRFCIASADFIAHKVEEAQHMDRISLIQGLDDPSNKPHVDVFVPDGRPGAAPPAGDLYDATVKFSAKQIGGFAGRGAAREATLDSGGSALYLAGVGLAEGVIQKLQEIAKGQVGKKAKTMTWDPDVQSNPFFKEQRLNDNRFYGKADQEATAARAITESMLRGKARQTGHLAADTHRRESVDGLWLTAQSDRPMTTLERGERTAIDFRAVLTSRPEAPDAFEIAFHGTLSIANVTQSQRGIRRHGTLSGIYSLGILKEDQPDARTTEYLITERGSWPATVTSSPDDVDGISTLEVHAPLAKHASIRFGRGPQGASEIEYWLDFLGEPGAVLGHRMGHVTLTRDADAANPANRAHQLAEAGLDLVQAALIVSEPEIKAQADAQLFPAAGPAAAELTIDAVRDWVMFMKRREKQCSAAVAPVAAPQLRRYRVLNMTCKTFEQAALVRAIFESGLRTIDRTRMADWINRLLADQEDRAAAVLTYENDSVTPHTDLDMADWRSFAPGRTIYYAAIGSVGDVSDDVQTARLIGVEEFVGGRDADTEQTIIAPYPENAVPPDADGIMVFITVDADKKDGLVITGTYDGGMFVPKQALPYHGDLTKMPTEGVIEALGPEKSISRMSLYTSGTPDAEAGTQINSLHNSLKSAVPMAGGLKPHVGRMTNEVRAAIKKLGQNPDDFDHVILIGQ